MLIWFEFDLGDFFASFCFALVSFVMQANFGVHEIWIIEFHHHHHHHDNHCRINDGWDLLRLVGLLRPNRKLQVQVRSRLLFFIYIQIKLAEIVSTYTTRWCNNNNDYDGDNTKLAIENRIRATNQVRIWYPWASFPSLRAKNRPSSSSWRRRWHHVHLSWCQFCVKLMCFSS